MLVRNRGELEGVCVVFVCACGAHVLQLKDFLVCVLGWAASRLEGTRGGAKAGVVAAGHDK